MREQRLTARQCLPEHRIPAHGHAEDFLVLVRELVLTEHPEAESARDGDRAFARLDFAAQDVEKGGLPRAVGAHEPVALAGLEAEGDIAEERSIAEGLGEAGGGDHGRGECVQRKVAVPFCRPVDESGRPSAVGSSSTAYAGRRPASASTRRSISAVVL